MDNNSKVKEVLSEGRICITGESERYIYFAVKGSIIYDVIYNKDYDTFSCPCKNIRFIDCYHIKACREVIKNGMV